MKTKAEIVENWLPRYTGTPLKNFGSYILLTNFIGYVNIFSEKYGVDIEGMDKAMQTARITISPLLILEWEVPWQQRSWTYFQP